jgi:hypothetical protein
MLRIFVVQIIHHLLGKGDVFVGIGDANIISKVGLGQTIQAGIGKFNILTSVGDNDSLQIAIGKGNLITKVGSGHSAMIAIGKGDNISLTYGKCDHTALVIFT